MLPVVFPDATALALNLFPCFQLGQQESGQQIGRQITGTDIDPGIFVDLSPEKLATIGSLLADEQRSCDKRGIVDNERHTFSAGEVLGLMEAQGGKAAESSCIGSFIAREEAMRIVLDDPDSVARRGRQNRIHVAGNSR